MIDAAIDALDFERPFALYEQMTKHGVAPDEYTYIRLINLCGKQKKLDKAQVCVLVCVLVCVRTCAFVCCVCAKIFLPRSLSLLLINSN